MKLISLALTLMLSIGLFLGACNKNDETPSTKIAGENSKVWEVDKARDADGDRVRSGDRKGSATFYTNGQFTLNDEAASMAGTWSVNSGATQLTLSPNEMAGAMAFDIEELSRNKMVLRNGAGEVWTFDHAD